MTRRPNPCLLRAESMSGLDGNREVWGGLQPLYLLFLLEALWDHFAPGVPHQGPWCTSPGQWLSWPKGDGVKCNRSEGPRRESRSEINETHPFITCRSFEGRPWYSPIAMIYEGPSLFLSTYFVVTSQPVALVLAKCNDIRRTVIVLVHMQMLPCPCPCSLSLSLIHI